MYSSIRYFRKAEAVFIVVATFALPLSGCSVSAWWDVDHTASQTESENAFAGKNERRENANRSGSAVSSSEQSASTQARPNSITSSGGIQQMPGVEIVWQVPSTPVEVFHINYGYSRDQLRDEITVPVDRLEKFDHPAFGPVFRYYLRGVSPQRDIFVSMQAENRLGVSSPSETIAIPAIPKQ